MALPSYFGLVILAAVALGCPASAYAQNSGFAVSMETYDSCDINGATGIGPGTGAAGQITFSGSGVGGTYVAPSSGSTPVTPVSLPRGGAAGSLHIVCTGAGGTSVTYDGGLHLSNGVRHMQTGSGTAAVQQIGYTLGLNSSYQDFFAPGVQIECGCYIVSNNPFIADLAFIAFVPGGIPAGADGSYTDTVQVTLSF